MKDGDATGDRANDGSKFISLVTEHVEEVTSGIGFGTGHDGAGGGVQRTGLARVVVSLADT